MWRLRWKHWAVTCPKIVKNKSEWKKTISASLNLWASLTAFSRDRTWSTCSRRIRRMLTQQGTQEKIKRRPRMRFSTKKMKASCTLSVMASSLFSSKLSTWQSSTNKINQAHWHFWSMVTILARLACYMTQNAQRRSDPRTMAHWLSLRSRNTRS